MFRTITMCRALMVMALLCLGLMSRPASAAEVLGGMLVATGGPLSVTVQDSYAGYTSYLYLKNPDPNQPDIYIAENKQFGTTVTLPTYPAGTPLQFYIDVPGVFDTFFMGDGTLNIDGLPHAEVDYLGAGQALVGFEDIRGGGDLDYNDNIFLFQGVARPSLTISGCSVTPDVLWSPDHKMVDVTVNYTVDDGMDGLGGVTTVLTVTSNEPDNGLGDGDTNNDFEVIDANHVRVRAERSGKGTGRVYTITITATDSSGNTSTHSCYVTVPHSM